MSSKFRRSETIEQHEFEQQIHDQQLNESMDDVNSEYEKMSVSEDGVGKKTGVFNRLKNQIKASFPEAIQDLKIMGGLTALETRVKKEVRFL